MTSRHQQELEAASTFTPVAWPRIKEVRPPSSSASLLRQRADL